MSLRADTHKKWLSQPYINFFDFSNTCNLLSFLIFILSYFVAREYVSKVNI